MANEFKAEVFQNPYLPVGSGEVHAIMTVTAGQPTGSSSGQRQFGILCDTSGSMEGAKIVAAKEAIAKLIGMLPPDSSFFVIAGASYANVISGMAPATAEHKERALQALRWVKADGGTYISTWLHGALEQFKASPPGIRQALLLTDGQNDGADASKLDEILAACEGKFQCDCRGVGTDWDVAQLKKIAGKLLGTTDIIAQPWLIQSDFQTILEKAMGKSVSSVSLRLWTPQGAAVKFCKEVSPAIVDLTGRAQQTKPQVRDYPTGAWGKGESRDFHFCVEVNPGRAGEEVLAGRASLVYVLDGVEMKAAEGRILAIWTDDDAKSTKIDQRVAHYTGQAELADSIQAGLEAKARGEFDRATVLLGKAVKLAHDSGNEGTAKLLRSVVDVENADQGTVRLKSRISKEDEMALETRSTKTARVVKSS